MATIEHRDFGLAVHAAVRIEQCFLDIHKLLVSHPAIEGDNQHYITRFSIIPHDPEVAHEYNSKDLAYFILQNEVVEGRLPVWLRLEETEHQADARKFVDVDRRTWCKGVYMGNPLQSSYLDGRPLWVKHVDNSALMARVHERWSDDGIALEDEGKGTETVRASWSDAEMIARIAASNFTNRDIAWREHFKSLQYEHGWDNAAFRHVWSLAKGTRGSVGRPLKIRGS